MKRGIWILCAVAAVMAVTLLLVPTLRAQQRRMCACRAAQPPEAQVLLRQEWARAHAQPGR